MHNMPSYLDRVSCLIAVQVLFALGFFGSYGNQVRMYVLYTYMFIHECHVSCLVCPKTGCLHR